MAIDRGDYVLSQEEQGRVDQLVEMRLRGVPLQQVLGEVDFHDLKLRLTKDVLIPRQETEILAERIIESIDPGEGKVALDLCTGSGCIGLAVKKALPQLKVILSDISPMAADIA